MTPTIRDLEFYIGRLEAYERGETDAVPYVPAITLICAKAEIERLTPNNPPKGQRT